MYQQLEAIPKVTSRAGLRTYGENVESLGTLTLSAIGYILGG